MQRFKFLLSGLFLIYLIIDGYYSRFNYSFYLAAILLGGLLINWYYGARRHYPSYDKSVRISSIPAIETDIIQLLGHLMRSNELEMRLRRAEFLWNVTFLKNTEGVTRILGRGSAPSISEAIMRAEGDFEKRNTPISSRTI